MTGQTNTMGGYKDMNQKDDILEYLKKNETISSVPIGIEWR